MKNPPIIGEGFLKEVLSRYTKEEISFGKMAEFINMKIKTSWDQGPMEAPTLNEVLLCQSEVEDHGMAIETGENILKLFAPILLQKDEGIEKLKKFKGKFVYSKIFLQRSFVCPVLCCSCKP